MLPKIIVLIIIAKENEGKGTLHPRFILPMDDLIILPKDTSNIKNTIKNTNNHRCLHQIFEDKLRWMSSHKALYVLHKINCIYSNKPTLHENPEL